MKKMIFAALFAAFSTGLFGQKVFVSAGVLSSDVTFKNVSNVIQPKSFSGYFGGVRLKIGAPGPIYFAPSLQVSTRGYKLGADSLETTNRNLHVDLNAMLGWKIAFLSLEGGVYGSTPLSEKFKVADGDWQKVTTDLHSKIDGGVAFGAALTFGKIGIFGRYNIGYGKYIDLEFTDISGIPIPDFKAQNRFFQLGLNYRI